MKYYAEDQTYTLLRLLFLGYEDVFSRRAFGGELDEDELVQFFKECDLMPANHEIAHALDLVFKGKSI